MSLISIRKRTNNMSKVVIWFATIALIIGGGFMGLGSYFQSHNMPGMQQDNGDQAVAKVNGTPITRRNYDEALNRFQQQMSEYGQSGMSGPLSSGELHATALNQAVNAVLVLQLAKKRGLTVTDADTQAEKAKWMDKIKEELGLSPNATDAQVESNLQKVGQSVDRLVPQDRLANAALSDKYNALVQKLATPSPEKVGEFYTGLHTEHILISNKSRPDAQALDQAKQIIATLNKSNGTNFEALAKQYSDDPGTKAKGGDDGFVTGQTGYVDEFMNAAHALKAGQWTQAPVLAPQFGYFVIKLLATRDDKPKDFATKQSDYIKQIASTNAEKLQQADLEAAQKTMKVDVVDPQLKADWSLMNAFKQAGQTGGKPAAAVLNTVVANYTSALKVVKDSTSIEQMRAQLGILYRMLDRPADELTAFLSALNAAGGADPDLAMQIGDVYKKQANTALALQYYQTASKYSYDNLGVHMQLAQDFKDLKQTDLAQKEQKWITDYNARQKSESPMSGLGSQPITLKRK